MMDAVNKMRDYANRVRVADVHDRDVFKALMAEGMDLTGTTLQEAAVALKTSQGSVSRWVHGFSAPADLIRQRALNVLAEKARRIVRGLTRAETEKSVEASSFNRETVRA